jgi:hypothetical protein
LPEHGEGALVAVPYLIVVVAMTGGDRAGDAGQATDGARRVDRKTESVAAFQIEFAPASASAGQAPMQGWPTQVIQGLPRSTGNNGRKSESQSTTAR